MKTLTSVIVLVAATLGYAGQTSKSLSSEEILKRQVEGVDLSNVTMANAFTRILRAAHVPGGFVTTVNCGETANYSLTPQGSTLRDALDSIVSASPQHRWFVEDGAVYLVPSSNDPILLNFRVTELEIKGAKTVDEMVSQILTIPELQRYIAQLNLTRVSGPLGISELKRPGYESMEESSRFTLHRKDIKVREALNAIARIQGSGVWEYSEHYCVGRKEFSINFLVQ